MATMRCSMCGHEFAEEAGHKACARCALFGGCRMIMCPQCGYEMPAMPALIKALGKLFRRSPDKATKA